MATFMDVEILEDGTVSVTTGDVEGTKHVSADELLMELGEALGGNVNIKKREGHKHHTHVVRKGNVIRRIGHSH